MSATLDSIDQHNLISGSLIYGLRLLIDLLSDCVTFIPEISPAIHMQK